MVQLYWSESYVTWNALLVYCAVYLHWSNLSVKAKAALLRFQAEWVATQFWHNLLRVVSGFSCLFDVLCHFWWLVRVTLVVDWLFLPQNFGPVVGTYEGLLRLCEWTLGGDSSSRWWGQTSTICDHRTFFPAMVVGGLKPSITFISLPSLPLAPLTPLLLPSLPLAPLAPSRSSHSPRSLSLPSLLSCSPHSLSLLSCSPHSLLLPSCPLPPQRWWGPLKIV